MKQQRKRKPTPERDKERYQEATPEELEGLPAPEDFPEWAKADPKHATKIKRRKRRLQAIELRNMGATFEYIAKVLGYSHREHARRDIYMTLDKYEANGVEQLRNEEGSRLLMAQAAIWDDVLAGNLKAINAYVKISKRRSEVYGIDPPQKIAPTDPTGQNEYGQGSIEEARAQVQQMLEKAKQKILEEARSTDDAGSGNAQ